MVETAGKVCRNFPSLTTHSFAFEVGPIKPRWVKTVGFVSAIFPSTESGKCVWTLPVCEHAELFVLSLSDPSITGEDSWKGVSTLPVLDHTEFRF